MVGSDAQINAGIWSDVLDFVLPFRDRDAATRQAQEALKFVGLGQHGNRVIDELTLVDQRRVEIARALASRPRLLLLDEPAGGMSPSEIQDLTGVMRQIQRVGITVLLVEHHMRFVMTLAEWITVLDAGRVIADGTPEAVRRDRSGDFRLHWNRRLMRFVLCSDERCADLNHSSFGHLPRWVGGDRTY